MIKLFEAQDDNVAFQLLSSVTACITKYVRVLRGVGQGVHAAPPSPAGAGSTCRAPRCGDQVCATGILARANAGLGANLAAPCSPAGHSGFKVYVYPGSGAYAT